MFSCDSEKSKCLTLQRRKSFAFKAELFFKALELATSNKWRKVSYDPISDVSSIRQTWEGDEKGIQKATAVRERKGNNNEKESI